MGEHPLLALDIGTRKVAGLLTLPSARGIEIIAAERMEHTTRAMYDGQIHDVGAVAAVVRQVVEKLTAQTGFHPTEAAVAAAGRSLRTAVGTAARAFSGQNSLTRDDVLGLELEAVQAAQASMAQTDALDAFHYVGHSVTAQRLDGAAITKLEGQRGREVEVDVIATFLPRTVIDSLQAVLDAVGLRMRTLTLEPIAALGVVVPATMRHLNLLLVDIGAGTSDIALTRKGSVVAYDMVPTAGDEITETLSEAYLLDFPTGEKVKRQIGKKQKVTFQDILGHRHTVAAEELRSAVAPAVENLAEQIAQRVLRLNGGPPQAVLLVGGGSLTPGLEEAVAAALGLPANRVAVRGRKAITGVEGAKSLLKGPDAVTPIGIAVSAREQASLGFLVVQVNGRTVRLFQPHTVTVADALLAADYRMKDLYGPIGPGITVFVNGELRIVPGSFGTPARILVNGEEAALESPIHHQDQITVEGGGPGQPGKATVADVAPEASETIWVETAGKRQKLCPLVRINGNPASPDDALKDNDRVEVLPVQNIGDVAARMGLTWPDSWRITLNGKALSLPSPGPQLRLDGQLVGPETPVSDGDQITLVEASAPPIFADLLPRLPLAEARPAGGGRLVMRLNGQPAEFTTPLHDGDVAEVRWED